MTIGKNILAALAVFIINLLAGYFGLRQIVEVRKLEHQQVAMQLIANIANTIDQQLSMSLSSTKALGSIIQQYGDIPEFDSLARQMIEVYGGISCLQLAPDGIISKCFPLKGNESIIGGNLLTSPNRKTESFKTIESGELTLAGPFKLSQGGTGTIGRFPVFISDKSQKKQFWGFTIAVINLPDFLNRTGIAELEKTGYNYWLWCFHPDTKLPNVFASNNNSFNRELALEFSIPVPNNIWTLSVVPKKGWINKKLIIVSYLILIFASFIIALLVYKWLGRNDMIAKNAELLKQSSQNLIKANATKDKFFSIIAHDLRGPVGSLRDIGNLLNENFNELEETERRYFISQIQIGADKTLNLLDNLLLWARSQKDNIEYTPVTFSIAETISLVLELYINIAQAKQQKIIFEKAENIMVFADKEMVTTVLRNLISNAIKFTPNNGIINIVLSSFERSYCLIKVNDSGIGIDSDRLKTIFELERTSSTKGTGGELGSGLGLLLCKEFVDKNNGKIGVESNLGEGATFFFTLPLSKEI